MERLEQIKSYTTIHKNKQGDRYLIQKEDLHWLIEQVEMLIVDRDYWKQKYLLIQR